VATRVRRPSFSPAPNESLFMNTFVFDIETVPDVASGRRLFGLDGIDDEDVARAMLMVTRKPGDTSTFLRHHLHRIVAISAVFRQGDRFNCWSLGDEDSDERELLERFFEGIEKFTPTLVSWNGSGFDLPVIHYRAMVHAVAAPRYWDQGGDDSSFRWNNYLSRFHERHTDLMDVLSAYQPRAAASLDHMATICGFPGKVGMSGGDVWDRYLAGDLKAIRDYCETDVLNTYLVYLRFEHIRGRLQSGAYDDEVARVRAFLAEHDAPHFKTFLDAWDALGPQPA